MLSNKTVQKCLSILVLLSVAGFYPISACYAATAKSSESSILRLSADSITYDFDTQTFLKNTPEFDAGMTWLIKAYESNEQERYLLFGSASEAFKTSYLQTQSAKAWFYWMFSQMRYEYYDPNTAASHNTEQVLIKTSQTKNSQFKNSQTSQNLIFNTSSFLTEMHIGQNNIPVHPYFALNKSSYSITIPEVLAQELCEEASCKLRYHTISGQSAELPLILNRQNHHFNYSLSVLPIKCTGRCGIFADKLTEFLADDTGAEIIDVSDMKEVNYEVIRCDDGFTIKCDAELFSTVDLNEVDTALQHFLLVINIDSQPGQFDKLEDVETEGVDITAALINPVSRDIIVQMSAYGHAEKADMLSETLSKHISIQLRAWWLTQGWKLFDVRGNQDGGS